MIAAPPFPLRDEALPDAPPQKRQRTHADPSPRKGFSCSCVPSAYKINETAPAPRSISTGSLDSERDLNPNSLVYSFPTGSAQTRLPVGLPCQEGTNPCSICSDCGSRLSSVSLPPSGAREMRIVDFCLSSSSSTSSSSSSSSQEPASQPLPLVAEEFHGKDLSNLCLVHKHERDLLHALRQHEQPESVMRLSLPLCPDHPTKQKTLFCLRCEEFACEDCKAYPTHRAHAVLLHYEAMGVLKDCLTERVQDLRPKITALVASFPRFLSFADEEKVAHESQKQNIEQFFDTAISRHPEETQQYLFLRDNIIKGLKRPSPVTLLRKSTYFGPVTNIKEQFETLEKFSQFLVTVEDVPLFFSGVSFLNKLFDRLEQPFLRFTPEQLLQQHLEDVARPKPNIHHFKKAALSNKLPLSLLEELRLLPPEKSLPITGLPLTDLERALRPNQK